MNRNIRITVFSVLLPALVMLIFIPGCKKATDNTGQVPNGNEFLLRGSVVDAKTHQGIANASVYIVGQPVITTNANGQYQVNCKTMANGSYDVRVTANGYGYGFASAGIASNSAMVNTINLKPLDAPVAIGSQGGTLSVNDPESFVGGSTSALIIPAGAFTGNVNVTFTRFTGIDVPGIAPANSLNLCTVNIGPANTPASKPVELRFAMPFADATIDQLPLMRYDFNSNSWVGTGTFAQVNHGANTATAQITEFGTYSLATTGSFSEGSGSGGVATKLQLSPTLSYVNLSYLAKHEFPNGTPLKISYTYLANLASQNTKINGSRVSFSDSTKFTFTYIGSKPDSIPGVKSTSGYYRWVPEVSHAPMDIPMTTSILDVTVSGIIHKELYSDACGWQYAHDQGGGGK
jgi:hypothetical protein